VGSKTDPDYLFKLERAIAAKYGEETIVSLKSNWSEEDEDLYQESLRKILESSHKEPEYEKGNGFIIRKRKKVEEKRVCSSCGRYSLSHRDSLYLNKYNLCEECFFLKEQVKTIKDALISGKDHGSELNDKENV